MLVPMVHLRVQVPARDASAATRAIARAGLLHLVDLAHGRAAAAAPASLELLAAFRDLERRVREVARRLAHRFAEPTGRLGASEPNDFADERTAIETALGPVERAAETGFVAMSQAREQVEHDRAAARRARTIREAGVPADRLAPLHFCHLRFGVAREEEVAQLAALLEPAPFSVTPLAAEGDAWLFALAVPSSGRDRLASALRVVPCELFMSSAADPDELDRRADAGAAEVERRRVELAQLQAEAGPLLDSLVSRVQLGVLLLQAQLLFAAVGHFVVISGWVPAADAPRLTAALAEATGRRAVVDLSAPESLAEVASGALRVPILHRNPLLLRPFEKLVHLYSTPSYREVEPTAFFAVSFILMFGFMFGDVGHGLTLFAAGFLLLRYFGRFLDYGILLMEAGASSTLFGVLYGSLFGREDLVPSLWMRPMHDLPSFLAIATGLGVVLISVGLVLNVINTWRAGERAHALVGVHGLFGAFLYWVTLALLARALLPHQWRLPTWALLALAGAPVLLLAARPVITRRFDGARRARPRVAPGPAWLRALEGSVELVDVMFSFFANTFSFMRVAAFAAVHAGIMIALLAIVDTLGALRLGGLWAALGMVAGNVVVIFLEGLTVSVQILRLEYYEFFTRFFRGGGEPYRPLMLLQKGNDHEPKKMGAPGGRPGGAAGSAGGVGVGAP